MSIFSFKLLNLNKLISHKKRGKNSKLDIVYKSVNNLNTKLKLKIVRNN